MHVKLFKLSNRFSYVGTLTSISGHFHVEILHLPYTRFFFKSRLHLKHSPSTIYHAYTHQTMHTELCCHQLYTPLCFLSKLALKLKLCILLAKQVIRNFLQNGKSDIHTTPTGPFQIYSKIFRLLYVMMKYVFFSPFLSVENRPYRWHKKWYYQQKSEPPKLNSGHHIVPDWKAKQRGGRVCQPCCMVRRRCVVDIMAWAWGAMFVYFFSVWWVLPTNIRITTCGIARNDVAISRVRLVFFLPTYHQGTRRITFMWNLEERLISWTHSPMCRNVSSMFFFCFFFSRKVRRFFKR